MSGCAAGESAGGGRALEAQGVGVREGERGVEQFAGSEPRGLTPFNGSSVAVEGRTAVAGRSGHQEPAESESAGSDLPPERPEDRAVNAALHALGLLGVVPYISGGSWRVELEDGMLRAAADAAYRAGREDAARDIARVADSTRQSLVSTPPEYANEATYHRIRAVAFERAVEIARGGDRG